MKSIKINSSVGEDGILRLSLPVEFTNTNLEVMIILQPIENNLKKNNDEEVKIDRELCLNTLQKIKQGDFSSFSEIDNIDLYIESLKNETH